MAALTLASIPSHINSYERLIVWATLALQSAANGKTAAVVAGQGATPVAQVQVGVAADNSTRFVVSAYIPVDMNAIASTAEKLWMAAQDVTTSTPNAAYGSN